MIRRLVASVPHQLAPAAEHAGDPSKTEPNSPNRLSGSAASQAIEAPQDLFGLTHAKGEFIIFAPSIREAAMPSHLKEVRERLKGNKLTPEDVRYLDGLA